MKLPKFKEYERRTSSSIDSFTKKVAIASDTLESCKFFEHVKSSFDISPIDETPLIVWNNFSFKSQAINESTSRFIYNRNNFPKLDEVYDSFIGESFIPKTITDRKELKKLKFPIIAIKENELDEFKTFGKFKKSEKFYLKFREKITPNSEYTVSVFRSNPIHIEEKIKGIPFDVNVSTFSNLQILEKILTKLYEKYNMDFYSVDILESNNSLYLGEINSVTKISPSLGLSIYENAYIDYYETKLPTWVKNKIFEEEVIPYYRKRYYDSLLLKPKNSIDFKKYLK